MKRILAIVAITVLGLAFSANASQWTSSTQSIHGYSTGDWSILTAWNLYTGAQTVSSAWYSGNFRFEHAVPNYGQWIARFVYDQGTGQTRSLAWYYDQAHVQ